MERRTEGVVALEELRCLVGEDVGALGEARNLGDASSGLGAGRPLLGGVACPITGVECPIIGVECRLLDALLLLAVAIVNSF